MAAVSAHGVEGNGPTGSTADPRPRAGWALWVSTCLDTQGGVSSYVGILKQPPLWSQ